MSIADKLRLINSIKKQIANAIADKGVSINDETPLSEYPSKINSIAMSSTDTTAPVVDSFEFIINVDQSVSFSGKTESGASVLLRNPNAKLVPISLNDDGSFTAKILAPVMQGTYTLIVADASGNTTTVIKEVTLPVMPVDPIVSLFGSNVEGFYYDPNDLTTLFQDVEGTIPVTAVGQTVARINDKSGNGHHLVQATVSRQPKLIQDSQTFTYGLFWDGIDDHMQAPFSISADVPNAVLGIAVAGTNKDTMPFAMGISDTQASVTSGRGLFLTRNKGIPTYSIYSTLKAGNTLGGKKVESYVLSITRHSAIATAYAGQRYSAIYNDTLIQGGVASDVAQALLLTDKITMFKVGCNTMTSCQTFKMFGILRKLTEAETTEVNSILKSEVGV